MMETDSTLTPEVLFRPVKRQKFPRRRPGNEPGEPEADDTVLSTQNIEQQSRVCMRDTAFVAQKSDEDKEATVSSILRLRKPHRIRRGGIEFSTGSKQNADSGLMGRTGVSTEDMEGEIVRAKFDRFTAHTGQKVDVDKHMYHLRALHRCAFLDVTGTNKIRMEYIESELAKRQHCDRAMEEPSLSAYVANEIMHRPVDSRVSQREPATLGKLHEIDLGQEAKLQNIARTEAATRRLACDRSPSPQEQALSRRTRLGKDGKPWRGRRPRNSDDIERDKLVEEVLRESKLEVYDELEQDIRQDDQAADDRIAEQFRRDFLEAIQSRRRAARPRNKVAKADVPRGPKLGGSRSARAAMRESQGKPGQK